MDYHKKWKSLEEEGILYVSGLKENGPKKRNKSITVDF